MNLKVLDRWISLYDRSNPINGETRRPTLVLCPPHRWEIYAGYHRCKLCGCITTITSEKDR